MKTFQRFILPSDLCLLKQYSNAFLCLCQGSFHKKKPQMRLSFALFCSAQVFPYVSISSSSTEMASSYGGIFTEMTSARLVGTFFPT